MCITTTGVQQKQCFQRGGGGSIASPALTSQAVFTKTTYPDSEEREMCGAVQFQFQSQNNYAPRSWCFFWKPSLWAHYLKAMKIRDLCLLLVVIQWLSSDDTFWFRSNWDAATRHSAAESDGALRAWTPCKTRTLARWKEQDRVWLISGSRVFLFDFLCVRVPADALSGTERECGSLPKSAWPSIVGRINSLAVVTNGRTFNLETRVLEWPFGLQQMKEHGRAGSIFLYLQK